MGVKGFISCEAAALSATCYLLPLITVACPALVGVSTSLTLLSLVQVGPGEKNELFSRSTVATVAPSTPFGLA